MLSIRAYARHRAAQGLPGRTHEAVRKALARGRIVAAADGLIDPEAADRAWAATSSEGHRRNVRELPAPPGARTLVGPPSASKPAAAADLVDEMVAIGAELQASTLQAAALLLPRVLEGAAEALQAAGREPTAAAVAEALRLADGVEGPAAAAVIEVLEAVDDPDLAHAELNELARQAGRGAVAGR